MSSYPYGYGTVEEQNRRLHTVAFYHLTCPLAAVDSTAYGLEWLQPELVRVRQSVPPRAYHLAPQYVRCVGCGKVYSNQLGQDKPLLLACRACELQPFKHKRYSVLDWGMRDAGFYHLTREEMLSYNQLCRQLVAALPQEDTQDEP